MTAVYPAAAVDIATLLILAAWKTLSAVVDACRLTASAYRRAARFFSPPEVPVFVPEEDTVPMKVSW